MPLNAKQANDRRESRESARPKQSWCENPTAGSAATARGHRRTGPQRLQHHRADGASRRRASIAPRHPRAAAIAGPRKPQISTPGGYRGLLDRKHQRCQPGRGDPAEQLRAGRGRDRRAAAADDRRGGEPGQPALRRRRHAAAQQHQRDLAHAQRAVTDDKAAAAHLREQRGSGGGPVIDADPGGVGVQFGDDQRRDHRRQRLADRGEGLLDEHRPEGGQHQGQSTAAPLEKFGLEMRSDKAFFHATHTTELIHPNASDTRGRDPCASGTSRRWPIIPLGNRG